MSAYEYTALDTRGRQVKGLIEGDTQRQVRQLLRERRLGDVLVTSQVVTPLQLAPGSRILLIGGEPFAEPIVMWWNFIGRSHDEIVEVREKWNAGDSSIPAFVDLIGGRTLAPAMPNLILRARV